METFDSATEEIDSQGNIRVKSGVSWLGAINFAVRTRRFALTLVAVIRSFLFGAGILAGAGEIARVEAAAESSGLVANMNIMQENMVENLKSVMSKLVWVSKTVDTHEKMIKLLAVTE